MPRNMGDIYTGMEDSAQAHRTARLDPSLTIARAHTHHCYTCARDWYCWCFGGAMPPGENGRRCSACAHEEGLPKVVVRRERGGQYKESRLFNNITVSEGGWTGRWVSTRELRAALERWTDRGYKASPPEVSNEGGAYQCGGCRFFLALDSDYGLCANAASPHDGRVVFEHVGCTANPHYIANHQEAHDD